MLHNQWESVFSTCFAVEATAEQSEKLCTIPKSSLKFVNYCYACSAEAVHIDEFIQ
jgi:hypothetical protein